jgi:outer membrane biogenesis lipoprotein LolB
VSFFAPPRLCGKHSYFLELIRPSLGGFVKPILSILAVILLAGCGADTTSAAATAAALKKQEIEQGKKTMDQVQQRIKTAADQMQQGAQRGVEAAESNY